jgi:Immunity protein 35
VDQVEARELARRELGSENLVVTDAKRIGQTWVVSYNSREYVETGDLRYFETGPSLRILVSDDGRVVRAPSTRPTRPSGSKTLAEWLAESEQQQP